MTTKASEGVGEGDDLLHAPIELAPARASPYPRWAALLVSLFITYHLLAVLVQILPGAGLTRSFRNALGHHLAIRGYIHATSNGQSWKMFAPNPHRTNIFVRVLVEDASGELWDLRHDPPSRRGYPYLFYDRRGKLDRRLADTRSRFQAPYAAWVCRQWEFERLRAREGARRPPAREVVLVRRVTRIPPPKWALANGGYDPRRLRPREEEIDRFTCKDLPHGQIPNLLRVRHGLPRIDERREFRDVPLGTWWTRARARERAARQGEVAPPVEPVELAADEDDEDDERPGEESGL